VTRKLALEILKLVIHYWRVEMISVWINGQQRDGIDEGWINRTVQGLGR
jgi:hypothetical protein